MEVKKTRLMLWTIALVPTALWGNMLVPVTARAQIAPDGTLPTEVMQNGNNFKIDGGGRGGGNLFHSFQEFSVPTGGEAFFNNSMDVENIFSRVTGGNISNIDGLIRANGSANLFLLNPAGIVFGPNARLNIGGSFLGSTASSLLFPNGQEFSTINQASPLLTINAPIGLWFRGNEGNIVNESIDLKVEPGQSLGLVGGNVSLNGGIVEAPGGRVDLGGLAAAGTVGLNNNGSLNFPELVRRGNVSFADGAIVDASGEGGGTVTVNANDVNISGESLLLTGIGPGLGSADAGAGDITIDATGAIEIDDLSGVFNEVGAEALGDAGNIEIKGRSLSLSNGAQVNNSNFGQGNAGNVTINVDSLELTGISIIFTSAFNSETPGSTTVNAATSISISGSDPELGSSGIFAVVQPGFTGNGNELRIETGRLLVEEGAQVAASTVGRGDAGNLTIRATESVEVRGSGSGLFTDVLFGLTAEGEPVPAIGNGGNLQISTAQLIVEDGAKISASTLGKGNAGDLTISDAELVKLSGDESGLFAQVFGATTEDETTFVPAIGDGGELKISTDRLIVQDGASVSASTFGEGDAGNLTINATESIEVRDGGGLFAQVNRGATGAAGLLEITTGELQVLDGARVFTRTSGQGSADNLIIETDRLIVRSGGQISASTLSAGNAGNLTVNANSLIELTGTSAGDISGIFSSAIGGTGDGGNVDITTEELIIQDGAIVNVGNFPIQGDDPLGSGNPGNINIQAGSVRLNNGSITAATVDGDRGNIRVNSRDSMRLQNGSEISASTRTGIGGNVMINAGNSLIIDESSVTVSSTETGAAGNITVNAREMRFNRGTFRAETAAAQGNINLTTSDNIELRNQSAIATDAREDATGGNIFIKADFLIAHPGNNDITANAEEGNGGKIEITAGAILGIEEQDAQTGGNDITVSSTFGSEGEVIFNIPDVEALQGIVERSDNAVEAVIVQACRPDTERESSSFRIVGRGGVPRGPQDPLTSDSMRVGGKPASQTTETRPPIVTLVEDAELISSEDIELARGWIMHEDGVVELTAYPTPYTRDRPFPKPVRCPIN